MTDAPATVWARENPVWATVFPVAQTVVSEAPPVRPVEEGGFRVDFGGVLRELTKIPLLLLNFTTNCQNLMRHAGVISERGSRWWLSCPFSRLTNVKGAIAHLILHPWLHLFNKGPRRSPKNRKRNVQALKRNV